MQSLQNINIKLLFLQYNLVTRWQNKIKKKTTIFSNMWMYEEKSLIKSQMNVR